MLGQVLLLPIVGFVYVAVTLSLILQTGCQPHSIPTPTSADHD
jgi:hypothetical protein